ncbi:MAG: T9SS type A sorting domain-containing protein [Bacteroidetes bacterium]|nr:T9SS type A sorting domain-containing protein [Bacteroidota bacterium]
MYTTSIFAQYPPPVGKPGTTAIFRDSSVFIGWASKCTIGRGFINVVDTNSIYNESNKATYGSYLYASGPADDFVVSLGDQGSAILGFDVPITNRDGPDFAVFENSFGNSFLELGFVEVSSDGLHYVRFPAVSLTQENIQVSTFDTIDATKIHNFAGKYKHAYGTPFDLADIRDSAGVDINNIINIRIIDAIGCVQDSFATRDSQGHKVNDPWPTPFDTGGFDLDAIGVLHNTTEGIDTESRIPVIRIYPNPVDDQVSFISPVSAEFILKISDPAGKILIESVFSRKVSLDLSSFSAGIYFASFKMNDGTSFIKKIIKY